MPACGEVCFVCLSPGTYLLSLGGRGRVVRLLVELSPGGWVEVCHSFAAGRFRWRTVPPVLLCPPGL